MAIPAPLTYVPIDPYRLGVTRPILAGAAPGYQGGGDIARNALWSICHDAPHVVLASCNPASTGYVAGAGLATIKALWAFAPAPAPFVEYDVEVRYQNTGPLTPADDGTIRFDLESDPYAGGLGTYVDLVARGGTAQWGLASGYLSIDTSLPIDTIRMMVGNGATGSVRVHSVSIRPRRLAALAAGKLPIGSVTWVPIDDTQIDELAPWSIWLARTISSTCEVSRRTRRSTYVSYSDDPSRIGTSDWQELGAAYVEQIRIPIVTAIDEVALRWSVRGYRAGATGSVRLHTGWMDAHGIAAQVVALGAAWASPYTTAQHLWSDPGQGALAVAPNAKDWIYVDLAGDGVRVAHLVGLQVWGAPT